MENLGEDNTAYLAAFLPFIKKKIVGGKNWCVGMNNQSRFLLESKGR